MDPITHCLIGGMAAKTAGTTRRRFWIMLFLGIAPDLDVVFNFLGSWAFWLQHRGITHSLAGIVAQAFIYAWLFRKWDVGPFRERVFHYFWPLALHAFCDVLTSHGVPLLSPFSFYEYSVDLMAGLSLIPILFMSVGLFLIYREGTQGWHATRPVWMGWLLYMMVAVSGKAYASRLMGAPADQVITIPSVANPFVWVAMEQDEKNKTYKKYDLNLLEGVKNYSRAFPMPDQNFPVHVSLKSVLVQNFLKEARWPVSRVLPRENGWMVEWGNILFSTRGVVRGKIRVEIDSEGEILSDKKIFNFWDPPSA